MVTMAVSSIGLMVDALLPAPSPPPPPPGGAAAAAACSPVLILHACTKAPPRVFCPLAPFPHICLGSITCEASTGTDIDCRGLLLELSQLPAQQQPASNSTEHTAGLYSTDIGGTACLRPSTGLSFISGPLHSWCRGGFAVLSKNANRFDSFTQTCQPNKAQEVIREGLQCPVEERAIAQKYTHPVLIRLIFPTAQP